MRYPKETRNGLKRKSSDSTGSGDVKKEKVDHVVPVNSTEHLFDHLECVQSILSFLTIEDLANVSRASHFLKLNTLAVFKTVHAAAIDIEYDPNQIARLQMVFETFGSVATKVTVSSSVLDEDDPFDRNGGLILGIIGHYCGNDLKELCLRRMQIDISPMSTGFSANKAAEVRAMLATLVKLSLTNVCIKSRFFLFAQSLKELSIHSCCHFEEMPQVATFPELKTLNIGACPTWPIIPGDNFNEFLRVNPSIEEINYHFITMARGHLKAICSLPKLIHLQMIMIRRTDEDLSLLANARRLKKLIVQVRPCDREQFEKLRNRISTCEYRIESLYSEH